MDDNNRVHVITTEADEVARTVRTWLNTYTDKPEPVVDAEHLGEYAGLAMQTIQAAYKTRQYITGGYQAQFQFALLYRTITTDVGDRLEADERLNAFGRWAESTALPTLGTNIRAIKITRNTNSALVARWDDGAEDHELRMTLIYEVNV